MLGLSTKTYSQNSDLTELKGSYLGQKPPGKTPEVFAPGLVATDAHEFSVTISKDGNEIYFSRRESKEIGNRIHAYKNMSGKWVAYGPPLFGFDGWEAEPNLSPDESRMYFGSRRPKPEGTPESRMPSQWYVDKIGNNWSTPQLLGSPVAEFGIMFLTQANSGTIYFTGITPKIGLYSAKQNGDSFETPVFLPKEVNGNGKSGGVHPYIAPDESYILFDYKKPDGVPNLYICFNEDNTWSEPFGLAESMGYSGHAAVPFVSFDGKYIFFATNGDIKWVDANIIEELRPKN